MRSVLGYAVFIIGLALAAQAFFPGSLTRSLGLSLTPSKPAAERTEAPAPNVIDARAFDRVASFSPGARLAASAQDAHGRMDVLAFLSRQFAGLKPAEAPVPARRDVALSPWRSAVVPTSDTMSPDEARAAGLSDGARRIALIREIQRELKRVGCYDGSIDGSWGAASKQAMIAFIQRVNASLPLSEPDNILLLLLKGQQEGICGVACPLGQALSRDRRCVPDAILANAGKPPRARNASPWPRVAGTMSVAPTGSTSLWPQSSASERDRWAQSGSRMSIGGPQLAPDPSTPANETSVVAVPEAPQSSGDIAYAPGETANEGVSTGDAGQQQTRPPVAEPAPAPAKPRLTARSSRSAERRERRSTSSGTKSVQHLFEHPLGRL